VIKIIPDKGIGYLSLSDALKGLGNIKEALINLDKGISMVTDPIDL